MLERVIEKTQAWETLQDRDYCSHLGMEDVRRLMLLAGYSPEAAHEAAMQRGRERLAAGDSL